MPLMGVDNLKANLSNPARSYLWEVIIPNVLGGGADTNTLLVRAQSTSIPGRSYGAINVPYKQTAGLVFPGKLAYTHKWTVTFIEGEDGLVHDFIHNWKQLIVDDLEGIGQGDENIKTDILLSLVRTQDGEHRRIKLVGAYPEAVNEPALTYEGDSIINYEVTFSFDRWEKQV